MTVFASRQVGYASITINGDYVSRQAAYVALITTPIRSVARQTAYAPLVPVAWQASRQAAYVALVIPVAGRRMSLM